jgi:TPR repeat protein
MVPRALIFLPLLPFLMAADNNSPRLDAKELLNSASTAQRAGDPVQAAKHLRALAECGSAMGQYNLGVAYYSGDGVQQNFQTAASWYEKAARQGNANAQYNLADLYDQGKGVPRNRLEACRWSGLAAPILDQARQKHEALGCTSLSREDFSKVMELMNEVGKTGSRSYECTK